jgi:hypothetical protein
MNVERKGLYIFKCSIFNEQFQSVVVESVDMEPADREGKWFLRFCFSLKEAMTGTSIVQTAN